MKPRRHFNALLAFMLSLLTASCRAPTTEPSAEILSAMQFNPNSYSDLDPCLQIRLFTDVGMRNLENDHSLVFVPDWMDAAISQSPRAEVARCIGVEGSYRIGLWSGRLASKDDTVRAVHALLYKARELGVVGDPGVTILLHKAVCESDLDPGARLLLIYWYGMKDAPPDYAGAANEESRMKADLCGSNG